MKFNVGYQVNAEFIDQVLANKESVSEVYFSWWDLPNGRHPFINQQKYEPWESREMLVRDLRKISSAGIKLNLLLNGNCYGAEVLTRHFQEEVFRIIDYLETGFGLEAITLASHYLAEKIKKRYSGIKTRASVNIRIGTQQGMDYVAQAFDGYYMQREYNRDLERIKQLREWCDENGKKLFVLANSGCINFCSAQVFHDNLVSHEAEINKYLGSADHYQGICWDYLQSKDHFITFIKDESWIRPEDIDIYHQWFDGVKLATRVALNPGKILNAYIQRKYTGNLLDLLEPNHSRLIIPYIIENRAFPKDFAATVLSCNKSCSRCNYCQGALDMVFTDISNYI